MAIENVIARLQEIRSEGLTALDAARDAQAQRDAEVRFLDRKGGWQEWLPRLEEPPECGRTDEFRAVAWSNL